MTTPMAEQQDISQGSAEEFEILLVSDEQDPGYGVIVPALPGCFSQGDDWEDALAMAADAIACHLAPPSARPTVPEDRKERIIAECVADGCRVEVATVRVVL